MLRFTSAFWVTKRFSVSICVLVAFLCAVTGCQESSHSLSPATPVSGTENQTPRSKHDTPRLANATYVDDATCADCHADIMDTYQHVAMAKSFYDFDAKNLIESFEHNQFYHPLSDNHYEMNVVDGLFELTRFKKRADGTRIVEHRQKAQYVVGSGNHVRTYLYRNENGEMFQLPVVWYSQDKKWGMAPGYDSKDHSDFLRPITRQCLFCHNAYPEVATGSDTFGMPHRFPRKMPQGIGCQRCHGPGSEHVRIASEAEDTTDPSELQAIENSIVNSAKLSPKLQDAVCNQCHFQPMSQRTSFVRKFGKSDYSFKPGQSLSDFMIHFEPDRNNDLADHFEINHHPYRLYQSKCFIETEGGIRCTHCHDPHAVVEKSDRQQHYRQKCFTCHGPKDCGDVQNGHLPDANCVSCHMPTRRTTDVIHVTMTDHKIVRRSKQKDPIAARKEINVPIDMPIRQYHLDGQELPNGYSKIYEFFARVLDDDETATQLLSDELVRSTDVTETARLQLGQKLLQEKQFAHANKVLKEAQSTSSPYLLNNLGISELGLGQNDLAIATLKKATKADPDNPLAWYNLGVAYSRKKDEQNAIASLENAIRLRPNYVKARNKLGSIYAAAEQLDAARIQFESAIGIDARNLEGYRKLAAIHWRLKNWPLSNALLRDGLSINKENVPLTESLIVNLLDPTEDPTNKPDSDPEQLLALTDRLVKLKNSEVTSLILQALALLQTGQPEECLTTIKKILPTEKRKPETGIILAIAQKQLGSNESAIENYRNAKTALGKQATDKLSKLIEAIAQKEFQAE